MFTADLERRLAFYQALGIELEDKQHGDGLAHSAGALGDAHFAIFPGAGTHPAPSFRDARCTFVGIWADCLEEVAAGLRSLGADQVFSHEQRKWGCRVMFADPDGRPVEVNQRSHSAGDLVGKDTLGPGSSDARFPPGRDQPVSDEKAMV